VITMAEYDADRDAHLHQLRWSLAELAIAGSEQRALFPEYAPDADDLAFDFDHWSSVVRSSYDGELTRPQIDSLEAIAQKLATMSRDGAEFDVDLWTEAALGTSEHWADVRRLASAALEAFGWPVESRPQNPGDRGTVFV
jgi:hypothetical protein